MNADSVILRVDNLYKHFPVKKGLFGSVVDYVKAVDGVSFALRRGETLGLVGESGCGKTTLGRCILRLIEPTAGRVVFDGATLTALPDNEMLRYRHDMQIIFQDPFSSLNPRMTTLDIVGEALAVHGLARGAELEKRVVALLEKVGLPGAWINRYPHEFSGGQRQRIGIARAIALNPKFIVCDEPVSALDVSIQAQVINLLIQLRNELNLSYLFIAHNLAVVKHIANRIAVMYLGKIVETAASGALFAEAVHPYTRALLSAIPDPNPRRVSRRIALEGDVPSPLNPPTGCPFHPRCPTVMEKCRLVMPDETDLKGGHVVRCYLASDVPVTEGWYERVMKKTGEMIARNKERAGTKTPLPAIWGVEETKEEEDEAESEAARATEEALAQAMAKKPSATRPAQSPDSAGPVGLVSPAGPLSPLSPGAAKKPSPPRCRAGLGLLGLGALSTLLAHPGVGAALVVAAYLCFRLPENRIRWRGLLLAAVGLAACAYGGLQTGAALDRRAAMRQYGALKQQIDAYESATGDYPQSLSGLGWRLYNVFSDGKPLDPWGHPWQYHAPGEQGRPYDLLSLGPDGKPGGDDVGN